MCYDYINIILKGLKYKINESINDYKKYITQSKRGNRESR